MVKTLRNQWFLKVTVHSSNKRWHCLRYLGLFLQVGSAEHAARLNVYGLPFVRPMEKKAIVAGETLVVTCPVAGYPIESIVWERG